MARQVHHTENRHKHWTAEDLAYACRFYEPGNAAEIGAALGRTAVAVRLAVGTCKKNGTYEKYKTRY